MVVAMKVPMLLSHFSGEYYLDKKHGHGLYTWSDGRRYDGMWQNGKQHGEGKYTLADGTVKLGVWKDGKRLKWLQQQDSAEYMKNNEADYNNN